MTVWAVVYSNYDPPEVHSLWSTQEKALAKRDELSETNSMWEVLEMAVDDPEQGSA